jgi:sugar phosphate permease
MLFLEFILWNFPDLETRSKQDRAMQWHTIRSHWNDPLGYRWAIFAVLSLIYFLACLHRVAPTVIAQDLVLEFSADATALGVMSSAYFYLYAAVQPPVGMLSDTIGPRAVTSLFAFIACAGVLLFGFAPSMGVATTGRALVGIGVGGVFIPAVKIFSRWYREKEFAGITGIFLAVGNAGNLSASLPLTWLVLALGWRVSFQVIGALTLFLGVLAWLVLRDKPEDKGWPPLSAATEAVSGGGHVRPADMNTLKRLKRVFREPNFWMVSLSYFFLGGTGLTFQGLWAVPYLIDVHGFSRMSAGGLLMLIPLGFIIGAPGLGFLADRLPVTRKSVITLAMGLGLACWGLFLLSGGSPPAFLVPPLFLIIGISGGGALPLYFAIIKELFPPWLTGTAIGFMNPAAFLGAALFQPFSGYLMDIVGSTGTTYPVQAYYYVFIAIFIAMATGLLCILPLAQPRAAPEPAAAASAEDSAEK